MAPQTATRMTYEEFMALPDDGKRYELIEGELILNPSPVPRHQEIVGNIYAALRGFFQTHAIGRVFLGPLDIVLADATILEPDVLAILNERAPLIGPKNVQGAPDIAVEVLSPWSRRRDEGVKRRLYEHHGVNEYWIVDPESEIVRIYRRAGAAFDRPVEIHNDEGGSITSPLLPNFSLDVRDVFAE